MQVWGRADELRRHRGGQRDGGIAGERSVHQAVRRVLEPDDPIDHCGGVPRRVAPRANGRIGHTISSGPRGDQDANGPNQLRREPEGNGLPSRGARLAMSKGHWGRAACASSSPSETGPHATAERTTFQELIVRPTAHCVLGSQRIRDVDEASREEALFPSVLARRSLVLRHDRGRGARSDRRRDRAGRGATSTAMAACRARSRKASAAGNFARRLVNEKKRRGRHPGRNAPPAHLPRVPVFNRVPPELRVCPQCGATMTPVSHSGCLVLNVIPARVFVEERLDETVACPNDG